jgi:hypothetical protein
MQNSATISHQVSPVFLQDVSAGKCLRALVNKSEIITKSDGDTQ